LVLASFNCWCVIQKSFHPLYETIVFGNPDPMQLKIKPVLFYFWIGCGFTASLRQIGALQGLRNVLG